MISLRQMIDPRWGLVALLSMIATVKMADTGAYTAGRLFGKHKLIPRVSPGKTWEGLAGGFVVAIVAAAICLTWLPGLFGATPGEETAATGATWWMGIFVYGVVLTLAGLLGDLTESLLKRDAGRKDSSNWLPGMGGVLDILDSLLLGAPAAYLCWMLGLVGP
jgi:phosphatidate cytidylyltransferase